MKAGVLVGAMAVTGVVGGVVGALLVQGSASPAAPPAAPGGAAADASDRSEALAKEVAQLRARLEEMQGAVTTASQDAVRAREEVEKEVKAAAAARLRPDALEKGAVLRGPGELPLPATLDGAVPIRLGRVAGARAGLPASVKKTLELMAKPEEERWAAIRDALSLNSSQEEELKAAIKERDTAVRDLTKVETHEVTGPDGTTSTAMSVSSPDPEKMKEARRRYDDRVDAALTADQSKKWREDGYEAAAGGGGHTMVFSSIVTETGEPAGK